MEDLFFIERGYLNGNHFVYRSKAPIMIDIGYVSDFSETKALILDLGVDITYIGRIINTHCHCDHIGGNRFIQEKSGCEIALNLASDRKTFHCIDSRDNRSAWWKILRPKSPIPRLRPIP